MLEEKFAAKQRTIKELSDKLFVLTARETALRNAIAIKTQEIECSHIAGENALSECGDIAKRTSIVWHDLSPLKPRIVGLCTNCQRQFLPEHVDYTYWRSRPSFNKMSKAGGPLIVRWEGLEAKDDLPEDPCIYIPIEQTYYEHPQRTTEEDLLRRKDFESLSDFEIAKLFEYVRVKRQKEKETNE